MEEERKYLELKHCGSCILQMAKRLYDISTSERLFDSPDEWLLFLKKTLWCIRADANIAKRIVDDMLAVVEKELARFPA